MSLRLPNNQGPLMAFWSVGQENFAYPQNNPALPTTSTDGLTAEVAVGYHQEWLASDRGDEASPSLYFDYSLTALPVYVQLGPQHNFLPYQTQPLGAREHPNVQDARDHSNHSVRPLAEPTCATCNRKFKRIQELKRHRKDVHEPPRQCLFCTHPWTRPDKIQHHIKSRHRNKFTAKRLSEFAALRGKEIVEFLNRYYDYGLEVGTMPNTAYLDLPSFPALM